MTTTPETTTPEHTIRELAAGRAAAHPLSLFDLTDKVAIVTGATKGLGRAIAEGLAQAGARVVVSSRKQELCSSVADEIAQATGRETVGLACHVGEWESVPAFVSRVVERFGRIDVLINNAGISPAAVTVCDMSLELWRKVFSVNLEGPLRMSQCVAPVMRDTGGGSIVNIGTMAAYFAGSATVAYGASKAALRNLTVTMAVDWAPWNVRVNLLSPGPFNSEMVEGAERQRPGFIEMLASVNPQKRIAAPSEIIGPVLYLASDAASFVTGDDICVSGGMRK